MKFGLIVVGNEILSGKRQDKHMAEVIRLLGLRGLELAWARFVGDDREETAEIIRGSRSPDQVVFCCGGIGATPDDQTRQAAALAFGRNLVRHAGAEAEIVAQYGDKAYPRRVLMADFADGAGLIPNPVNRVAGFFLDHHYFVPGFPSMAWPMIEWVLDTRYAHLHDDDPACEFSLRVLGSAAESDLLDLMEATLARYEGIQLSSLPFRGDAARPSHIELGVRARRPLAAAAFEFLRQELARQNDLDIEIIWEPDPHS